MSSSGFSATGAAAGGASAGTASGGASAAGAGGASAGAAASGGASAGGSIYENTTTISANYTLTTSTNGMSVGPITVASGVTVTVPSGQRWVVL